MAGFFALAAFLALDGYLGTRCAWLNAVFCACVILGFLSHLTFVHFYLGTIGLSVAAALKRSRDFWRIVRDLARCHALPIAFLMILYFVSVRHLKFGGGEDYVMREVITAALSLGVGGPETGVLAALVALSAAIAVIGGVLWLWRENREWAVFFAVSIFLSPVLLLIATRPEALYVRYFYINILFFLMLLGYVLGRTATCPSWGRVVAFLVMAGVLCGNFWHTRAFLETWAGSRFRGGPIHALAHGGARSSGR